ncbi:MAG: hypothetical protein PHQ43_08085, partial [Dehalococcoidales bacterium]|nr:hypothetical protein [Dehalococcoidales bacterium]
ANILSVTGTIYVDASTFAGNYASFEARNLNSGSTVHYNGTSAQTIDTTLSYQNLTFSAAGAKTTASGTLSVAGNWACGSTTALNTNNTIVNLTGNLTGSGAITQGTGLITVAGDWTHTGTFTASSAGVTLTGTGKQITGSASGVTFTTLTINGTYTNNNTTGLTVSTTLAGSGTLTQGASSILNINAAISITSLNAGTNANIVNYNGTSAQTVKVPVSSAYSTLKINNANASGATLAGAITINAALTIGDLTSSSIFNDGGYQITSTGTLNLTSGTFKLGAASAATTFPAFATRNISSGTYVEYAAGVAQNISTTPSYQNLTFSGAGTKTTVSGTLTVLGNWACGSTTALNTNNTIVNLTGNLTGSGTLTQGTGLITIAGNWAKSGIFTASSAGVTLAGSAKQITNTGSTLTFTTLTINGTYTNNNTTGLTVSTALAGSGTLTQGSGTSLNIGGTSTITTLDASTNSNIVTYSGEGAQTVKVTSYSILKLSGSGAKTMAGVTAIAGLTIQNSATMTGNAAFTVTGAFNYTSSGSTTLASSTNISIGSFSQTAGVLNDGGVTITVTGTGANTWAKSGGTFTAAGTVKFTGAAPEISASNFYNLNINVGTSATLTGNITVTGAYTNTTGSFNANTKTVTVTGLASINGGTYLASTGTQTFNGGLTVAGGTFNASSASAVIDINGNVSVTSGTLSAPASTSTNAFRVSGNWSVSGTGVFTHNSGTLNLDGTGTQTVTAAGAGSDFFNLNCTTGGQTISLLSEINVYGTLTVGSTSGNMVTMGGNDCYLYGTSTPLVLNGGYNQNPGYNIDTLNIYYRGTVGLPGGTYGTIYIFGNVTVTMLGNVSVFDLHIFGTGSQAVLNTGTNYTLTVRRDLYIGEASHTNYYGKLVVNNSTVVITRHVTVYASDASGDNKIDATGNSSWTVGGNWANSDLFTCGNSTVEFGGGSGSMILNPNGQSFYALTINDSNTTWTLQGALTTTNNMYLTSGTLDPAGYTITAGGNFTMNGGIISTADNVNITGANVTVGGITVSGASKTMTITATAASSAFVVNGDLSGTGTITLMTDYTGTFNQTSGTISSTTGGIYIQCNTFGSGTGNTFIVGNITSGSSLNIYYAPYSITLNGNISAAGSVYIDYSGGGITINGNITASNAGIDIESYGGSYGPFVQNSGTISTTNPDLDIYIANSISATINNITATGAVTIYTSGAITQNSGATVTSGTGYNVTLGSQGSSTLKNINSGGAITLGKYGTTAASYDLGSSTLTAGGNFTINSDVTVNASTASINVGGNWANSGTFTCGNSTVSFIGGSGAKTINNSTQSFYIVIFNANDSTWTMQNVLTTADDIAFSLGTLDPAGYTITAGGNFTQDGGAITTAGDLTINVTGNFTRTSGTITTTAGNLVIGGANVTVGGITVSAASKNMAITATAASSAFVVNGNLSVTSGTMTLMTDCRGTFNQTSGTISSTTGGIYIQCNTFGSGTGNTFIVGNITSGGSLNIYYAPYSVTLNGNISAAGATYIDYSAGGIVINGNVTTSSSYLQITAYGTPGPFVQNAGTISTTGSGTTVSITGSTSATIKNITALTGITIGTSGTLTISGGMITTSTGGITINANVINQTSGSVTTTTSGDITINSTGTPGAFTLGSISSAGAITIGNSTAPSSVTINGAVGYLSTNSGNISITASGDITTGGNMGAIQSSSGNLILTAGNDVILGNVSGYGDTGSTSGTVTITATRDVIVDYYTYLQSTSNTMTVTAGRDINVVTRDLWSTSQIWGATTTLHADRDININGNVFSTGGALTIYADHNNDGTGVYNHTGGEVHTNVAGNDINIYAAGSSNMYSTESSGALNLYHSTGQTVTYSSTGAITVSGNLTIDSGVTLAALGSSISVGGNWTNSGTFTCGNSTVTFNGSAADTTQSVNAGSSHFNNIIISNTGTGTAKVLLLTNPLYVDGTFTNAQGSFDGSNLAMNVVNMAIA